jgi:glycosyltransferase involved in cell wall biosynthesis
MSINLGIITERLQNYGGSEIYLLECLRRWQDELEIVVYTTQFNPELFREYGIDEDKVGVRKLDQIRSDKTRFGLLDELVVNPRVWERQIGQHDLYFQYLFPTQLVRKSPSIWFAAEPLRMLYDLRHHKSTDSAMISYHVYPRMEYSTAVKSDFDVVLQLIEELDRNSEIETLATNSRMMDGYLETVYGRRAEMIAYPGINLPEVVDGPADNRTALYVGRFWRHKRIELILDALAMLDDGNLILVGDGAEAESLKEHVRDLGLTERVQFYKNLDNAKLDQIFRNVTCGIYTPVREPFGIMPLEAASHGLPVVVTPDGGYTEVLDASCAHIVPPRPDLIAEALESLFSNHELAQQMGAAGRKKVENFTWDHTADNLLHLFKRKMTRQKLHRWNRQCRPLLGAHYYPWYGIGDEVRHWNENTDYATVEDLPLQGPYSSDDEAIVARHLELAEQGELDYLVINLQVSETGLDLRELRAVQCLFDIAAKTAPDLSLCFMVTCDKADSSSIDEALAWLEENYFEHPSYLRFDNRPVLWFFITESFIGHFFYNYVRFDKATSNYHRIAASGFCFSKCLPKQYSEFFDGWSLYSPLQIADPAECERLWQSSYQEFKEIKTRDTLGVFTICPGFDDTGLTQALRKNTTYRKIERDETATYTKMQSACLALRNRPDLVIINSFNEFHENTHIEPSEEFGDTYIEATRKFSQQLRKAGGWDPRETNELSDESNMSAV